MSYQLITNIVLLLQMTKKHHNGHMIRCDWLDRLTFREIEMINERQKRESNSMYLMVEFPEIKYDNQEYTVVYFEKVFYDQFFNRK